MFSQNVVEGLKQLIRVVLIAVIPLLISQLQEGSPIDWRTILVVAAIALLSGIDKWIHETGTKTVLDLRGMDALVK